MRRGATAMGSVLSLRVLRIPVGSIAHLKEFPQKTLDAIYVL
jgi:hypothetical protein